MFAVKPRYDVKLIPIEEKNVQMRRFACRVRYDYEIVSDTQVDEPREEFRQNKDVIAKRPSRDQSKP